MPVTPEENLKYQMFVSEIARNAKCFDYQAQDVVWHYTNGDGLLGILQTGTIFATQVASLNDKSEVRYAQNLFQAEIHKIAERTKDDSSSTAFLGSVLKFLKENPDQPAHTSSKFFVASFSSKSDDVSQWTKYGGENGYAIGFYARGLIRHQTSQLYRVVYDRSLQEQAAKQLAEATLRFFKEGLRDDRDPNTWAEEFLPAWDEWIYRLAPLTKDPAWESESELRLVHELHVSELPLVRFRQKRTMLARYLPLSTPSWIKARQAQLPIARVMVGPGNHPAFNSVSVRLLLEQMGYRDVTIDVTKVPFQVV